MEPSTGEATRENAGTFRQREKISLDRNYRKPMQRLQRHTLVSGQVDFPPVGVSVHLRLTMGSGLQKFSVILALLMVFAWGAVAVGQARENVGFNGTQPWTLRGTHLPGIGRMLDSTLRSGWDCEICDSSVSSPIVVSAPRLTEIVLPTRNVALALAHPHSPKVSLYMRDSVLLI
jgi:hypothetical protein